VAGEGLFSVSRKFGVLQSEIIAANPNIEKGLKVGQMLYIPIVNSSQTAATQQDNAKKYLEHTVAVKQTFFSICKMYGVSQDEVLALNQGLNIEKINAGQIIKIPVKKQQDTEKNARAANAEKKEESKTNVQQKDASKKKYVLYEVKKKKESLYSISKELGVSINEILEANPEAENGVTKGDVLQIPVKDGVEISSNTPKSNQKEKPNAQSKKTGDITHIVQPKETIYGLSKKYNVSTDVLIAANPQLKDGLKVGQKLTIPQEKEVVEEQNTQMTVEELQKKHLKIVFLLPFTSGDGDNANMERFSDFYKGALLALEEAKKLAISADVQTFDTGFGTDSFYRILSEKFCEEADLIVGPAYPEQVSVVAAFAKKHKIAHVIPFTNKIEKADKHEYLYQFNPSNEEMYQEVADDFIEKFAKHNIVFINFADKNDKGARFADILKKNLRTKSIKFAEITADDAIETSLKGKKNILVFATSRYENISNVVPNIKQLNNNDLEFWIADEIKDKVLLENRYSYSIFNADASENYLLQYKKWFGNRTCNATPCYDLLGFDIVYYFCNAGYNSLTSTFSGKSSVLFQQSAFNFLPQKNGKGYLNYGYFLNCNSCK